MGNPFEEVIKEMHFGLSEVKSDLAEIKSALRKISGNKLYSVQEIAFATGNCDQTIRKQFKNGEIKGSRIGRKFMATQEEFDRLCSNYKSMLHKRN